jgi:hypothetical protein
MVRGQMHESDQWGCATLWHCAVRGVPGPSHLRPGSGIDCGDGYFALNLSGSNLVFASVDMHYVGAIAKASCVCTRVAAGLEMCMTADCCAGWHERCANCTKVFIWMLIACAVCGLASYRADHEGCRAFCTGTHLLLILGACPCPGAFWLSVTSLLVGFVRHDWQGPAAGAPGCVRPLTYSLRHAACVAGVSYFEPQWGSSINVRCTLIAPETAICAGGW